jgi:surfactin synthase thioesterase subunit
VKNSAPQIVARIAMPQHPHFFILIRGTKPHSLGALLRFKTARNLRRENRRQPAHQFVSATEKPHCGSLEESPSDLPKSALVKKLSRFNNSSLVIFPQYFTSKLLRLRLQN